MQFHHHYLRPKLVKVLSQERGKGKRLLDIGSADGSLTRVFSELGFLTTGIEKSQGVFGRAVRTYPQIHFINKDIFDVDIKDFNESFDIITAVEVIEHMTHANRFIKKLYSFLKPGGMLLLSTPYHGYIKNLLIALFNIGDKHYNPLADGWHAKYFSVKTIFKLLSNKGFGDIKFYYAGRFPFLWRSMVVTCIKK